MSKIRNVEQILPAVRSLLAKELINNHNVSKADVSKILGISPAAVTQYTKNKRGSYADKLGKNKEVLPIIASLAEHFANKKKKEGLESRKSLRKGFNDVSCCLCFIDFVFKISGE